MTKDKHIGLLSGMGAAAGAYLHSYLITACQRKGIVCDSDFPQLTHISLSAHGMDSSGICDSEALLPEILQGLELLATIGVESILIACNSAYAYLDTLQSLCPVPIFDMPGYVRLVCSGSKTGVISSQSTRAAGLYNWAMQISEQEQEIIDKIIYRAVIGKLRMADTHNLASVVYTLHAAGADQVVLCCTELILAMPEYARPLFLYDAGELAILEMLR